MKIIKLLFLALLFVNCSQDDDSSANNFLEAAVYAACNSTINYVGADVYGYPLTAGLPNGYLGWQLGGHPNNAVNEEPDLGINVFAQQLETGTYQISDSGGINQEEYVFFYYTDANGNQYVTNGSGGVANITVSGSGENTTVLIEVTEAEVYSFILDETRCIRNFEIEIEGFTLQ